MLEGIKTGITRVLRWSERYTKTDMVYVAESGFWMNLANILLAFSSFLLYIVFAHVLTKETYGTYQYFLSLSALIGSLTLTGMNYAITQTVARGFEGSLRSSVRLQLKFGIMPLLAALSCAIYYFAKGNTIFAQALLLMGLLVPVISAYNTFGSYLLGMKLFKEQFIYSMYTYLPAYALLGLTAIFLPNPLALLAVNLGIQAIAVFFIYRKVQSTIRSVEEDPHANSYGLRLSAVNLFSSAVGQIDSVLAFHFLGPAQLAIYSFATAIPDRAGGLLKFIYTAALPRFSNRNHHEIQATLLGKVVRTSLLALLAAGAYSIVAPFIFAYAFPQYIQSVPFSQLYSLTMLSYASNILVTAIVSQRYTREFAIFNISSSVLQTGILFFGIISFGLWGLVVGKIAASVLSGCIAALLFMYKKPQQ